MQRSFKDFKDLHSRGKLESSSVYIHRISRKIRVQGKTINSIITTAPMVVKVKSSELTLIKWGIR